MLYLTNINSRPQIESLPHILLYEYGAFIVRKQIVAQYITIATLCMEKVKFNFVCLKFH